MLTNFYKLIVCFFIVSLLPLSLVTPITAKDKKDHSSDQPKIATKADEAQGPLTQLLELESHKTHWYKFHYHYNNTEKHSDPTPVLVQLSGQAKKCLIFEVWTAGGLTPGNGQKHKSIGAGSPMKGNKKNLIWAGGSAATEDYYIAVKNKTDKACSYQLSIEGKDVSY